MSERDEALAAALAQIDKNHGSDPERAALAREALARWKAKQERRARWEADPDKDPSA